MDTRIVIKDSKDFFFFFKEKGHFPFVHFKINLNPA